MNWNKYYKFTKKMNRFIYTLYFYILTLFMGIKKLNAFLKCNCSENIRQIHISDLSGKYIVIDTSIYMYKYESEDALLENMYSMLAIFRHYNVIPLFVFDGKPPQEKFELLKIRREIKYLAEKKYNELKGSLTGISYSNENILEEMSSLKKQFVYLTRDKIDKVKELITAYGACYYDAEGESDEICASLVLSKKVWACMSDDMDMFVYGCTRVIRYFNLNNHTVVLYFTKGILKELDMTHKEFKELCVLSGTDYNINMEDNIDIFKIVNHFKKYKKEQLTNKNNIDKASVSFYEWLQINSSYITDIDLLYKINNMFDIKDKQKEICKNIHITNGQIDKEQIRRIMKTEGFLF